jgi:hypothetical protein
MNRGECAGMGAHRSGTTKESVTLVLRVTSFTALLFFLLILGQALLLYAPQGELMSRIH